MAPSKACESLAACIERARLLSPGLGPENDVYWHTRERAAEIARERGVRIPDLIHHATYRVNYPEAEIRRLSAPFWDDVAHPFLIVREVLES